MAPTAAGLDAEVVVVGAGVVGLAVAMRLAERHTVLLVERHESFGRETSSHNTGIVHAGLFYVTGSRKHRLCLAGNPLLYEWCDARSVRVVRTGKLIVALSEADLAGLESTQARSEANGVPGVRRLTAAEARDLEPRVPAVAALYSETSGVIDQWEYARSLEAGVREHGALVAYRHEVAAIEREPEGFRLLLRDPDGEPAEVRCGVLVNAAGHGAPALASLLGYPLDGAQWELGGVVVEVPVLRQRVNRGRYYDLVSPEFSRAVTRPVYPIPPGAATVLGHQATAGGLGLHVSVDVDGGVHLGPDTEWLKDGSPLDYRSDDLRRAQFLEAGRRLLPGLGDDDIAPGQVGYRPKLVTSGSEPADFLIWPDRGYVHLGGIESPGLTSSLAIADEVSAIVG
jgi:L-2-hydroxyglutarate oxidase LhgO